MAIKIIEEDGTKRAYILGAPSNEDCESLSRYFAKHWDAEVTQEYDVGSDAKYRIDIAGQSYDLVHGPLGNAISSASGDIEVLLKDPLADLAARLSD